MGFVQDITDFIFVEHEPEQADIIFIPGGRSRSCTPGSS